MTTTHCDIINPYFIMHSLYDDILIYLGYAHFSVCIFAQSYKWGKLHKTLDQHRVVGGILYVYSTILVIIISGVSLESMAEGVDKAVIVLVCMTQKYKDSPSCRTGKVKNFDSKW